MIDLVTIGYRADTAGLKGAKPALDQLARSGDNVDRSIAKITKSFGALALQVISVTAGIAALASGFRAADNWIALDNRIRLVTKSAKEFKQVQEGLIAVARNTFQSAEGVIQSYQRMAQATGRLGISQERLLGVVETVNKAVALSGAESSVAQATLIQFGQALSGNFQAASQELNSIKEQTPALAQAIADALSASTGRQVFVSDLKRMAEQGQITTDLVVRGFEKIKGSIDATFGSLARTANQAFERIKLDMGLLAKEAFGPLLRRIIGDFENLAKVLESPAALQWAKDFGEGLVRVADIASGILTVFNDIFAAIGKVVGALSNLTNLRIEGGIFKDALQRLELQGQINRTERDLIDARAATEARRAAILANPNSTAEQRRIAAEGPQAAPALHVDNVKDLAKAWTEVGAAIKEAAVTTTALTEAQKDYLADLAKAFDKFDAKNKVSAAVAGINKLDAGEIARVTALIEETAKAQKAFGANLSQDVTAKIKAYSDAVGEAAEQQAAFAAAVEATDLSKSFSAEASNRGYERTLTILSQSLDLADQFRAIEVERVGQIRAANAELLKQKEILSHTQEGTPAYDELFKTIALAESSLKNLSAEVTADAIEKVRMLREEISKIDDVLLDAIDDIFEGKFSFKSFFKDLSKAGLADLLAPLKGSLKQGIRGGLFGEPVKAETVRDAIETGANAADFTQLGINISAAVTSSVTAAIGAATGGTGFAGATGVLSGFSTGITGAFSDVDLSSVVKSFSKDLKRTVDGITLNPDLLTGSIQESVDGITFPSLSTDIQNAFEGATGVLSGALAPIAALTGSGGALGALAKPGGVFGALTTLPSLLSDGFGTIGKSFSALFGAGSPLGGLGKAVGGIAGSVGSAVTGALGGIGKVIGGVTSGLTGILSTVGSVLGPIGAIAGAVGGIIGFFKGLFSKTPKETTVYNVKDGVFVVTSDKLRKIDDPIAPKFASGLNDIVKALGAILPSTLGITTVFKPEKDFFSAAVTAAGKEIFSGEFKADQIDDAMAQAIRAAVLAPGVKGLSAAVLADFEKMKNITLEMIDEIIKRDTRRRDLEAEFLTYLRGNAGETLRAFNELSRRQRAERDEVKDLGGFTPDALLGFELKLQAERVKFLSELSQTQRDVLKDVVSTTEFAIADLLAVVNTEIEQVTENVVQTAEAFDRAKQSIRDFLAELDFGQFSNLSPREQFAESIADFRATLARAKIGDQDALAEITTLANRTLGLARDLFASGPRFQNIRAEIIGALTDLEKLKAPEPVIPTTSPVIDELSKIRDLVNQAINGGTGTLNFEAVRAALAAATTLDPELLRQIETALSTVEAIVPDGTFDPIGNAISFSGSQVTAAILSQSPLLTQIATNTGLLVNSTGAVASNTGATADGIGALFDASATPNAPSGGFAAPAIVGTLPGSTATEVFARGSRQLV